MDAAERPWSSVSGSDCLASVVIALVPRFRHRNRQLEHDRAVAESLVGRSQPRCPRRTSVALARSSLSGSPTPSHHDLDPKHHFAPLPRTPRSFQNSPRHTTPQKRIGHPPRNTKRIRSQGCSSRADPATSGSAGWLRLSDATQRGKAVFDQRGICWLVPRSNAPFNVRPLDGFHSRVSTK